MRSHWFGWFGVTVCSFGLGVLYVVSLVHVNLLDENVVARERAVNVAWSSFMQDHRALAECRRVSREQTEVLDRSTETMGAAIVELASCRESVDRWSTAAALLSISCPAKAGAVIAKEFDAPSSSLFGWQ